MVGGVRRIWRARILGGRIVRMGMTLPVPVSAAAERKEPTLSNQVKLINRHQKLMVGSAIGGVVVIGLFVLLLPNPFSGMNKLQAYCFYLGIVCLLLGFHSALRALTVEPTNVIYLQASSAWWSQTAVMGSSVAFLWVPSLAFGGDNPGLNSASETGVAPTGSSRERRHCDAGDGAEDRTRNIRH